MSYNFLILSVFLAIISGILFLLVNIINFQALEIFLIKAGFLFGITGSIIIWVFRMRFGHKRIDAILKNLMVVVITIGILMLIGEYTTRLIYNDIGTTGDNDSFFARRWKMKNVQLNSWGFREKEFNLVKPNNTYRIAVIGDSITYGQGVAI